MDKRFLAKTIIFLIFFYLALANSFANPIENNAKISNVENLKLLQEKDAPKTKTYSYEINKNDIYFEPQAILSNSVNGQNNNNLNQELQQNQTLNYKLRSNIGYDFSKYFTGFISYDLGNIGINSANKNVNLGIDASTIRINGVGSKINFSDDFGLKVIYYEQNLNNNGNSNIDKSQEINLKTILNF